MILTDEEFEQAVEGIVMSKFANTHDCFIARCRAIEAAILKKLAEQEQRNKQHTPLHGTPFMPFNMAAPLVSQDKLDAAMKEQK